MDDMGRSGAPSARMPTAAFWLGATGAIPFVASAVLSVVGGDLSAQATLALAAYGAVILSFLGGVHWGLAIADRGVPNGALTRRLALSVAPSLVGWGALLVGGRAGLGVLALAFLLWIVVDLPVAKGTGAPVWYPRLRWPLTITAAVCLTVGAIA